MNIIERAARWFGRISTMPEKINKIQEALGRIEQRQITQLAPGINDSEFRVFSQWGEDGIIQWLISKVYIENKIFIEFGVENYTEANTRFLAINNYWSGLVMDGSLANIDYIRKDVIYWSCNIKAEHAFITRENINELITGNGIRGDIGILSIDIDGNDYWIWEAIDCISPRMVICEYNGNFGPIAKVTIPYQPDFVRRNAHYSNIYYGASIAALECLGREKGYSLVGSNSAGNNVFFVRNDLCGMLQVLTAEQAYRRAQARESMDVHGELTFKDYDARLKEIQDLDVISVEDNKAIKIRELQR